ncbi:uncharacterized protein LACBIDRAFT_304892 [Laccaria bicolor S238N-H82]|uniref:Predicted protein n=1 Tax=Laccaria bicolor (strain S238N-H82 / ATCC MYA-4686) TaxID=486041 RepID=B0DMK6_LACBS|nr:uncharacterized protein LACBIDRAFT_304892 [Laccaria bicolor S238N-H82]EDR04203.1 predicted protein [Laccaria bicolor S238N-H82]|eukprot:XP_001885094.1 predicted protein [Laccaria bicolor S238N-H82]
MFHNVGGGVGHSRHLSTPLVATPRHPRCLSPPCHQATKAACRTKPTKKRGTAPSRGRCQIGEPGHHTNAAPTPRMSFAHDSAHATAWALSNAPGSRHTLDTT